jgi:RHS repeat-associated protein
VTIYDDDWSDTVAWDDSKRNEILYCGYRFDPETGLYHVRHRHYHPTLGRMTTWDPGGYVDGPNLVQYVRGSPIDSADPLGLGIWADFWDWWEMPSKEGCSQIKWFFDKYDNAKPNNKRCPRDGSGPSMGDGGPSPGCTNVVNTTIERPGKEAATQGIKAGVTGAISPGKATNTAGVESEAGPEAGHNETAAWSADKNYSATNPKTGGTGQQATVVAQESARDSAAGGGAAMGGGAIQGAGEELLHGLRRVNFIGWRKDTCQGWFLVNMKFNLKNRAWEEAAGWPPGAMSQQEVLTRWCGIAF